jgi:hypothetical protein
MESMFEIRAPSDMEWDVSAAGYTWMDGCSTADPKRSTRYLVPKKKVNANEVTGQIEVTEPTKRYLLQMDSDLFWKFARTELTESGILQFAKRYGLLGPPAAKKVITSEEMGGTVLNVVDGVALEEWKLQICWLRWAAELWLAASTNDRQALESMVKVSSKTIKYTAPASPFPRREFRAGVLTVETEKRLKKKLSPEDNRLLALDYAAQLLGDRLSQTTSHKIDIDQVSWDLVDRYAPTGLLGMLWVQFHSATQRKATYRNCAHCGTPFETGTGSGRTDRLYCSDYHRIAAVQARKKEALALRAQGKSPSAIARSIGADLEAVRRWVSGK